MTKQTGRGENQMRNGLRLNREEKNKRKKEDCRASD